jgi:hypothetical protein
MPDYQQGKVYGIRGGDEWYIGSTTGTLYQRYHGHKTNYKRRRETNVTTAYILFDKYGVENCSIELIELFPCNTKTELFQRERHYIESRICVNKYLPITTKEEHTAYKKGYNSEYRKNHKDELNKHSIQYRKDNVDKIEEKQSEKIECECGKKVRRDYLKKHRKRHSPKQK